ncbi:hypothetical protein LSH36_713g01106, partial [Paralvinella palmiformis]
RTHTSFVVNSTFYIGYINYCRDIEITQPPDCMKFKIPRNGSK